MESTYVAQDIAEIRVLLEKILEKLNGPLSIEFDDEDE